MASEKVEETGSCSEAVLPRLEDTDRVYREAYFKISFPLLESMLGMPRGMEIVDVSEHIFFAQNLLAIKVRDNRLPETIAGNALPEIFPEYDDKGNCLELNWNANGLLPEVGKVIYSKPFPAGRGQTLMTSVNGCQRCGRRHDKLTFHRLDNAADVFGWWAMCPSKGQPILLAEVADDEVQRIQERCREQYKGAC